VPQRQKQKVEKDTAERWLLTYADLMNLLLILFIILYTMSNVDKQKYQQVATSLRSAFGTTATGQVIGDRGAGDAVIDLGNTNEQSTGEGGAAVSEEQQMKIVQESVMEVIRKENLQGSVDVTLQERGIVISIKEKVLFRSGSADIDIESKETIKKIGRVLLSIPGKQIRVEGHTDTDPISTSRYPDNQELSTARANSVWRILVKDVGIDPRILSATGYGEFRPKVDNDSEENKAKNRRVDITILRDAYDKSEAAVSAP